MEHPSQWRAFSDRGRYVDFSGCRHGGAKSSILDQRNALRVGHFHRFRPYLEVQDRR
jgi:hypothetical protein